MSERTPGLFITGTDTGVGKTYVAALIASSLVRAGRRVGVYKPAASGCPAVEGQSADDDAARLWEAAGRPGNLPEVCPQCFRAPLAPHLAARAEGKRLDEELLFGGIEIWRERSDVILVEGAGGLMSPLGRRLYAADLAARFAFPLIVVAPNVLGTINQTLQTLMAAEHFLPRNAGKVLEVAGVVLNTPRQIEPGVDPSRDSNRRELALHCGSPILAEVDWQAENFDTDVDWFSLAR
jgi:dethiobiotin synthetase